MAKMTQTLEKTANKISGDHNNEEWKRDVIRMPEIAKGIGVPQRNRDGDW
jgi:hypothetical protein